MERLNRKKPGRRFPGPRLVDPLVGTLRGCSTVTSARRDPSGSAEHWDNTPITPRSPRDATRCQRSADPVVSQGRIEQNGQQARAKNERQPGGKDADFPVRGSSIHSWDITRPRARDAEARRVMRRPLQTHDARDVYDPFAGSGTTLIAAEQLGRRCCAIEIEPRYVQIAIDRHPFNARIDSAAHSGGS